MPNQDAKSSEWLEISIDIHPIAYESVSAFLFDLGCKGVVLEEFRIHDLKAYLPFRNNLDDTRKQIYKFLLKLKEIFPEVQSPKLTLAQIENQDWHSSWKRFFHADRITPKLLVIPAWEAMPEVTDGHVIRIDPGPAFGTGQHATTRMCLEAIERNPKAKLQAMLDVGTGSGILAIYGSVLGAKKIVAIDRDPEAIRWAERNIELNSLSGMIELSATPLDQIKGAFSVLTANLILGEILEIFPHFHRLLEPDGCLIVSGILRDQVEKVKEALYRHQFCKTRIIYQEEWACMIVRKTNGE
ncbi:MAG: 50S ribosomal protein L11 methyltransferase [Desulfobacteraceae bacterium]|nr:MAG: 50S ribosomal protein L11 methyltransferase [Desulfobacteraceae bacterium]